MNAQIVELVEKNEVAIARHVVDPVDNSEWLYFDIPNGWDDVKKVCKKALLFEGRKFYFSCWNSDRMECVFRRFENQRPLVASIVRR
jgi:hypothetical protein